MADIISPPETIIYNSKLKLSLWAIVYLPGLGCGLYIMFNKIYLPGAILTAIVALLLYFELRRLFNNKPQIIINNRGMQTAGEAFYSWEEISSEGVKAHNTGHAPVVKLSYSANYTSKEFDITDCAISAVELIELMRIYRSRYEEV